MTWKGGQEMHALTIYLGYDIARLCYIIYIYS